MSQRLFRNLAVFNVLAGLLTIVLVSIALLLVRDDGRDAAREVSTAAIKSCLRGAESAVAQLNFDYFVYRADFLAAKDQTVSAAERANRLAEAKGLLEETKLRANRVDVSALAVRGKYRLIDPRLRDTVRRIGFRCAQQYP